MCFIFIDCSISQNEISKDKLSVLGGFGNYEYLHAGINVPIKHRYYFETSIGIKPWDFNERYLMGYVCFGKKLLKQKPRKLNLYIHLKLIYWDLDNAYSHFSFLGINPELRVGYTIKKGLQLCGNIGGIYNTKLYYQRKTYNEVGWPKEWQPSFSLQLLYSIK